MKPHTTKPPTNVTNKGKLSTQPPRRNKMEISALPFTMFYMLFIEDAQFMQPHLTNWEETPLISYMRGRDGNSSHHRGREGNWTGLQPIHLNRLLNGTGPDDAKGRGQSATGCCSISTDHGPSSSPRRDKSVPTTFAGWRSSRDEMASIKKPSIVGDVSI